MPRVVECVPNFSEGRNEETIAAMKEARERKLETVTLDDLQAVIDANH